MEKGNSSLSSGSSGIPGTSERPISSSSSSSPSPPGGSGSSSSSSSSSSSGIPETSERSSSSSSSSSPGPPPGGSGSSSSSPSSSSSSSSSSGAPPILEIVLPNGAVFLANDVSPVASFVRFGLWDNAFNAAGAIINTAFEPNNFVGADSRRFYFRLRDPAAAGLAKVSVNWRTLLAGGANDDAPASQALTLTPIIPGSPIFVSRAVMLVTDQADRAVATNSGLMDGTPEPKAVGAADHRIRRGTIDGSVRGDYTAPNGTLVSVTLPIFNRNPDERRTIPIQLFVLRVAVGGAPAMPTGPAGVIWTRDLRIIRETYARIGMRVTTVVSPGTPAAAIVTNGTDSLVLIDPTPAVANTAAITHDDVTSICMAHPSFPNTIRVFYVPGLATNDRGDTYINALNPVPNPRRNASFINAVHSARGPYSPAHEMGHSLWDKKLNVGHYVQAALPAGNLLWANQNLMRNGTSPTEGAAQSKRLWDANDTDAVNEYTVMRASVLTR